MIGYVCDRIDYTREDIMSMLKNEEYRELLSLISRNSKCGIVKPYHLLKGDVTRITKYLMDRYYNSGKISVNQVVVVKDVQFDWFGDSTGITSDYSRFRKILGNRGLVENTVSRLKELGDINDLDDTAVLEKLQIYIGEFDNIVGSNSSGILLPRSKRVEVAIKSILTIGVMGAPILINEKWEIIEGQGRFEALKILGLPIKYIMQKGKGFEDCIMMNLSNTRWNAEDFMIGNAAARGNDSCKLLKNMEDNYEYLNKNSIGYVLFGTPIKSSEMEDGTIVITPTLYIEKRKYLDWANKMGGRILSYASQYGRGGSAVISERLTCMVASLCNYVNIDTIDGKIGRFENTIKEKRLSDILAKVLNPANNYAVIDIPTAINCVGRLYDYNLRGKLLCLDGLYKKFMTDRENARRGKL